MSNKVTSLEEYRSDDERVRSYVRARMQSATRTQAFQPLDATVFLRAKPKASPWRLVAVAAVFAIVGAVGALIVTMMMPPAQVQLPLGPGEPTVAVPAPQATVSWEDLYTPFEPAGQDSGSQYAVWADGSYWFFGVGPTVQESYRFDPAFHTWTQLADMPFPGSGEADSSEIAVAGQYAWLAVKATGEIDLVVLLRYDMAADEWAEVRQWESTVVSVLAVGETVYVRYDDEVEYLADGEWLPVSAAPNDMDDEWLSGMFESGGKLVTLETDDMQNSWVKVFGAAGEWDSVTLPAATAPYGWSTVPNLSGGSTVIDRMFWSGIDDPENRRAVRFFNPDTLQAEELALNWDVGGTVGGNLIVTTQQYRDDESEPYSPEADLVIDLDSGNVFTLEVPGRSAAAEPATTAAVLGAADGVGYALYREVYTGNWLLASFK
ncbi:MAG: hypothetical protein LBR58_04885 [Propionibacteriaceae bacterium]|jgi:hypothetical protein|nr:hypothetical protein [Propionibacteriaceae bacterium]